MRVISFYNSELVITFLPKQEEKENLMQTLQEMSEWYGIIPTKTFLQKVNYEVSVAHKGFIESYYEDRETQGLTVVAGGTTDSLKELAKYFISISSEIFRYEFDDTLWEQTHYQNAKPKATVVYDPNITEYIYEIANDDFMELLKNKSHKVIYEFVGETVEELDKVLKANSPNSNILTDRDQGTYKVNLPKNQTLESLTGYAQELLEVEMVK